MNYEQIKEVVAVFEASPTLTEIDLRGAGIALRLRRAAPAAKKPALPVAAPAVPAAPVSAFGDVLAGAASADLDEPAAAEGNTLITAHMVGVFRAARSGKKRRRGSRCPRRPRFRRAGFGKRGNHANFERVFRARFRRYPKRVCVRRAARGVRAGIV